MLISLFRAIVSMVYNVLKTLMSMNSKLFDELTSSYKSDRQRYIHTCTPDSLPTQIAYIAIARFIVTMECK